MCSEHNRARSPKRSAASNEPSATPRGVRRCAIERRADAPADAPTSEKRDVASEQDPRDRDERETSPRAPRGVVRYRGRTALSPYGMSTLAPAYTLVDIAAEIERADSSIGTVVSSKLEVIAQQIRMLQQQAEDILAKAQGDLDLHRARCSFARRIGHIYHLYEHAEGHLYWSMLAPEDWKSDPPHPYRGSYRLESDQSWTAAEDIPGRDRDPTRFDRDDVVQRLLGGAPRAHAALDEENGD